MSESMVEPLIDALYDLASAIFERAGEAFERRDLEAHAKCVEEHRMIYAAIKDLQSGATCQ